MKALVFFLVMGIHTAYGHSGHEKHAELATAAPLAGTSIYQLESKWTDQNGKATALSDLRGKPRLALMIYTRCETACPLLVEDLKDIVRALTASEKAKIAVSLFSVDAEKETPATLKAFVTQRKLPAEWQLLTGNAAAVAELAASLGVRYKRLPNGEYIHSNVIFLLDADGTVVAQKEGLKTPSQTFSEQIKKALTAAAAHAGH